MTEYNSEKKSPKPWLLIALAIPLVMLGMTTLKSMDSNDVTAMNGENGAMSSPFVANADHDDHDHHNHDGDEHEHHNHDHDGDDHGDHDHHLTDDMPMVMLNTVEEGVEGLTTETQEQVEHLVSKVRDFGVTIADTTQLEQPVTRGQLAEWLAKYKKLELSPSTHMTSFKDVAPDSPHYNAIEAVTAANLMHGYEMEGQNMFRPNQHLTREELCLVYLKWAGQQAHTGGTEALDIIPDLDAITESYRTSIATAYRTGFMKKAFGISPDEFEQGHHFSPQAEVTQLQGLQALFL